MISNRPTSHAPPAAGIFRGTPAPSAEQQNKSIEFWSGTMEPKTMVPCPACMKLCKGTQGLEDHLRTKHPEFAAARGHSSRPLVAHEQRMCATCGRVFNSLQGASDHAAAMGHVLLSPGVVPARPAAPVSAPLNPVWGSSADADSIRQVHAMGAPALPQWDHMQGPHAPPPPPPAQAPSDTVEGALLAALQVRASLDEARIGCLVSAAKDALEALATLEAGQWAGREAVRAHAARVRIRLEEALTATGVASAPAQAPPQAPQGKRPSGHPSEGHSGDSTEQHSPADDPWAQRGAWESEALQALQALRVASGPVSYF